MRPEKIEDLNDVRQWIYDEDARSEVYWSQQLKQNEAMDAKFVAFNLRLSALEKRVYWISGICSALGAAGGSLVF